MRASIAALALAALPAAAAVLNPPQLDPQHGDGCWVRFFNEPNFERPLGNLAGPMYINSLSEPGLIGEMNEEQFFRRVRSAVVGPEAKLLAYAEPGFRKELFTLEPNREVNDLQAIGFPKNVASLKIDCEKR